MENSQLNYTMENSQQNYNIVFIFNDIEYKLYHVSYIYYFDLFLNDVEVALYKAMFIMHNARASKQNLLALLRYKTHDTSWSIINIKEIKKENLEKNYKYWRKVEIKMCHKDKSCAEDIFWKAMEILTSQNINYVVEFDNLKETRL